MEMLLVLVVGLALAAIYFLPPPPPDNDDEDLDGPFDDLFNRSWSDWRD